METVCILISAGDLSGWSTGESPRPTVGAAINGCFQKSLPFCEVVLIMMQAAIREGEVPLRQAPSGTAIGSYERKQI